MKLFILVAFRLSVIKNHFLLFHSLGNQETLEPCHTRANTSEAVILGTFSNIVYICAYGFNVGDDI